MDFRMRLEYYNNIYLTIPDLKNYDGFGGRRSSEMMITSVDQSVTGKKTFQNIEVPTPTSNSYPTTKKYVDDLSNTKADLSKTTLQTFQGRIHVPNFSTSSFNGLDVVNVTYIENGLNTKLDKIITENVNLNNKQLTNLGFDIKNNGDVVNMGFTHQKYLQKVSDSDLDMDEHRVKNSLEPVNSRDLTTKNYVDTEIGKISQNDTSQFLKIDGTRSMTGDLDMDSHFIRNIGISSIDDTTAIRKSYVDNKLNTKADLSKTTTQTFQGRVQVPDFNSESHLDSDVVNLKYINSTFLNKKSGGIMFNPITFSYSLPDNKKQILNLGKPQYNNSAASKACVDDKIN